MNSNSTQTAVTAEFLKRRAEQVKNNNSGKITGEWLKNNSGKVTEFFREDRATKEKELKEKYEAIYTGWQPPEEIDSAIQAATSLKNDATNEDAKNALDQILSQLNEVKTVYGEFSSKEDWDIKNEFANTTYSEAQDAIRQIEQSLRLVDGDEKGNAQRDMLNKRLEFLKNKEYTDSTYYDAKIKELEAEIEGLDAEIVGLEAEKEKLLSQKSNRVAYSNYSGFGDVNRDAKIDEEIKRIDREIVSKKAYKENAYLSNKALQMREYAPRVEAIFKLGEDDPLEKWLAAAYELQDMDEYIGDSQFITFSKFNDVYLTADDGTVDKNYAFINRYSPNDKGFIEAYGNLQDMTDKEIKRLFGSSTDPFARLATDVSLAEKEVYNFIRATEGSEKADAFLEKHVIPRLNNQISEEIKKEAEAFAEKYPVASWFYSVANRALIEPLTGAFNTLQMAVDPEGYNKNWAANEKAFTQTSTIRQTHTANANDFEKLLYDVGTGFADLGAEVALSKILATYSSAFGLVEKVAGLKGTAKNAANGATYYLDDAALNRVSGWALQTMMSSKVAGATLAEARARGLSSGQAVLEAISSAAIEALTERIGLDNLMRAGGSTIRAAISEGLEEGLSSIANDYVDLFIAGDRSNFQTSVREQIKAGKSYEDAVHDAFRDVLGDAAYESVLGFLIGGVSKGSMNIAGRLAGAKSTPKSPVMVRRDLAKTKENAISFVEKRGDVIVNVGGNVNAYIDYSKQIHAVSKALTGQEVAAVVSAKKVLTEGFYVDPKQKQGADIYSAIGAKEGDVVLSSYIKMSNVGDAVHSVSVRLTPIENSSLYEVSGVLLDGDVVLNFEKSQTDTSDAVQPQSNESIADYYANRADVQSRIEAAEIQQSARKPWMNLESPSQQTAETNRFSENRTAAPEIVEDPSLTKEQRMAKIESDLRESAAQHGVSEDVTNAIATIAKNSGTHVLFVDQVYTDNGVPADGKFFPAQNAILISKNAEAPVYEVVKHELAHSIKGTKQYDALVDFVKNSTQVQSVLKENGIQFEQLVEAKIAQYAEYGENIKYDGAVEEIVADYVAKYLLTDQTAVDKLFKSQQSVFYKILYKIRGWIKSISLDKDARLLRQAEELYVKALSNKGKRYYKSKFDATTDTSAEGKYLIGYTSKNQPVVVITDNILDGVPQSEWVGKVKSVIKAKFSGGIPVSGRLIFVNKITRDEYTNSKNTRYYQAKDGSIYEDKMRASGHLDEIVLASTNYVNEDLNHTRKDRFTQFARGDVLIRVGTNDYKAKIIVGFTSGDNMVLYDVVDFTPTKVQIKKTDMRSPSKYNNVQNSSNTSVFDTTVSQNDTNVNTQYMQDDGKYSVGTDEDFVTSLNQLVEKYGAHKQSANAERKMAVPISTDGKTRVARGTRLLAESKEAIPDWYIPEFENDIINNAFSYEQKTNRGEKKFADDKIEELGFDGALDYWRYPPKEASGGDVQALGITLLKQAARDRNVRAIRELSTEIALSAADAGQTIQAMKLLRNATPEGQILIFERLVKKMNEKNSKKRRLKSTTKKADAIRERIAEAEKRGADPSVIDALYKDLNVADGTIHLSDEAIARIASQKSEAGLDAAIDEAAKEIASQIPATWADKWNQWRYIAMLFNLKTHEKNFFSNVVFAPIVQTKNIVKFYLESMFRKKLDHRESSFGNHFVIDKKYRDFVNTNYEKNENLLTSGGKHNPLTSAFQQYRTIYKTEWLEKLRRKNSELLEREDAVALKFHYKRALAQYLAGNKIDPNNVDPEALAKAEAYAVKEAAKATFRDESAIASFLQRIAEKNNFTKIVVEGLIPFKKTPINVAKRAIEYSPASFVSAISDAVILKAFDNVDVTANDIIDKMASGLTGSLIMGLGVLLRHFGVLTGFMSDNDKEEEFDKLQGEQQFALNIGGNSITIDWLAPSSLPLFTGVQLYDSFAGEGGASVGEVLESVLSLTDPLIELSMLQGIQQTMESASYSDNSLAMMISSAVGSYFSQGIPTAFGQVARVLDGTRRENYVEEGSPLSSVQYSAQQALGKIPFLSSNKKEYVNQWGETEDTGNIAERIFANVLSPSYYKKARSSAVDEEIERLYEKTKETSVLPETKQKSFAFNGKKYVLSADESTAYMKKRGKTSYEMLKKLVESSAYKKMTDEQRVYAVGRIYDYARDYAQKSIVTARGEKYELSPSTEKINTAITEDGNVADYLLFAEWNNSIKADKDRKGKTISGSKVEKLEKAARAAGYSRKEIRMYKKLLGYSV